MSRFHRHVYRLEAQTMYSPCERLRGIVSGLSELVGPNHMPPSVVLTALFRLAAKGREKTVGPTATGWADARLVQKTPVFGTTSDPAGLTSRVRSHQVSIGGTQLKWGKGYKSDTDRRFHRIPLLKWGGRLDKWGESRRL